jgi:hypothetical protein
VSSPGFGSTGLYPPPIGANATTTSKARDGPEPPRERRTGARSWLRASIAGDDRTARDDPEGRHIAQCSKTAPQK